MTAIYVGLYLMFGGMYASGLYFAAPEALEKRFTPFAVAFYIALWPVLLGGMIFSACLKEKA